MLSSNCAVCGSKKPRFIIEQKKLNSRLLSNLGIRTPLTEIPLVGPILF